MILRTKLRLTALLPLVVCLILSYPLILTSHRVHKARDAEQFANSVMQQMLELNLLTHAYLQSQGDPERIRWHAQHQAFSKLLTAAKPLTRTTHALIDKLRQNRQTLSQLTIQSALTPSPSTSNRPKSASSWQEGASGQLHVTLQAMLADANQLMRHSYQNLAVLHQRTQRFTLGLHIAIFSIMAWAGWFVGKHLLASPAPLHEGSRRMASENLPHRAATHTPDATGQLVQTLHQMTERLQQSHMTLHTEIAERQCTEEARQQRAAILRLVIDNVPIIIAYGDRRQRYQFANRTFEQWYGLPTTEVPKRRIRDIVGAAAYSLIRPYIEQVLAGQEAAFEMRMPFQSGQERFVRGTYVPHLNAEGSVVGYIALMEDISNRKRLEEDLKQFQNMQSIGTLASGIAHEFNNILAAMLGYTELTQDDLPRQSSAWHNLQAVRTAGMRAKEMVRQILAFSRQQPMERQPVLYAPLVKEVLSLLRVSLPKTIDIHQHIDCDVGYVIADRTQMHQIIMNLCSNAEHAMRQTGGVLDIRVDTAELDQMFAARHSPLQPGPHLRLSIRDSGHGIPAEALEQIFDPFFTTKEVGQGTGMGLAIVHGIISGHGGAITVESTGGVGTTFTIYLPCISAPAELKAHDAEAPIPHGKARILLVDDEAMLTRVAESMLTRLGYEVEPVLSPSEAIIAFQAAPDCFDLIITDQTMPQMTGVQLTAVLRQLRPDIPVILCTGFSQTMDAEQAHALGINAFLMKPLGLRELGSATHDVLAQQAKAA
ncbi:MAG: ATP-binding protein [Candidatus Tectomicrobia bacterium]|nr:ATP-binding protein [Candidatus Tectomicrobia bacterium]